ncbi:MAG: ABC transporter ATP-binding protein [Burkholderiales bacterium]
MSEVLVLDQVRAGYGDTVVLEDFSLSLDNRETLAILGRNGVGKTTLLATIMGHTSLHSGHIVFNGQSIEDKPIYERVRSGIGYVPQTREIFPSLTIEENLTVAKREGRWNLSRVYDLFPNLAQRKKHLGNQISGGEQQMLAIGRALMGNPTLLLLDEPMEGLAPIIVDGLLIVLEKLIKKDSLTIVLVEQSARLALQVTQRAIILDRGKITFEGQSAELVGDLKKLSEMLIAN